MAASDPDNEDHIPDIWYQGSRNMSLHGVSQHHPLEEVVPFRSSEYAHEKAVMSRPINRVDDRWGPSLGVTPRILTTADRDGLQEQKEARGQERATWRRLMPKSDAALAKSVQRSGNGLTRENYELMMMTRNPPAPQ
jgi:hypothetical protein